jgi:hypothetical protein
MANLMSLNLKGSGITDKGLEHLTQMKNLQELYLLGTKVTDSGVKGFENDVVRCKVVRH